MNKKIILMILCLPLMLMFSIFTSANTIALNVSVSVSKIEIAGAKIVYLDLDLEEKYYLNYSVYPKAASNKKIIFSTEPVGEQKLAELEYSNGYIVPKSTGTAKVFLTTVDGGFKDSFIVKVDSLSLQTIACSVDKNQLMVGETVQINTVFDPVNAENKMLMYTSSDATVASVNDKGVVRGEGSGQATITIVSEANAEIYDTVVVDVYNEDIMDLSKNEVYTFSNAGSINLSVDTTENYELSYEAYNLQNELINEDVFVREQTGFVNHNNGNYEFKYCIKETVTEDIIVKFTITTDNELREPLVKDCIIHRVEELIVKFDNNESLTCVAGSYFGLHNEITITPEDAEVSYSVELSNNNIVVDEISQRIKLKAVLPGFTTITLKVQSKNPPYQIVEITKDVVVSPSSLDIVEASKTFGIENVWTIGKTEVDGSENTSKVTLSTGKTVAGDNFSEYVSFYTDNSDVEVTKDGTIRILNESFNGLVKISARFQCENVIKDSEFFTVRCVGRGVNIRSFSDLYSATQQNKVVVIQADIKEDFGKDANGNSIYTEESVEKIQSTYDTTHYANLGTIEDAKVKVLISFKSDVYGNGYQINAHNVAYGLDAAGQLKQNALFKGPLNFVSMSESESSLVSVKGQDNICFAIYENVTLNNIELKACDLQADEKGNYDLTDLTYVGTTVEVLGDNVNIKNSRLGNGRTVLRVFGDITDKQKKINLNISNSVLSGAREFIIRMGSNCFVDGTEDNPSPFIKGDESVLFPAQKQYEELSEEEKLAYENSFIKTFVTLKNSILKDSGLFCIGIDTHFSGRALANGEGFAGGLISSWKDLAKTSYGAKLTLEGDVRMYDWKDVSAVDSSTLIEVVGKTSYADLSFDVKELISELANNTEKPYLNTIVYKDTSKNAQYVHGGIAFFGGGKNYGVVECKNYEFMDLNGYEVKLSDVGKTGLQMAAGNSSFYFLLNDSTTTGFLPEDQERILASENAYAPIYNQD